MNNEPVWKLHLCQTINAAVTNRRGKLLGSGLLRCKKEPVSTNHVDHFLAVASRRIDAHFPALRVFENVSELVQGRVLLDDHANLVQALAKKRLGNQKFGSEEFPVDVEVRVVENEAGELEGTEGIVEILRDANDFAKAPDNVGALGGPLGSHELQHALADVEVHVPVLAHEFDFYRL